MIQLFDNKIYLYYMYYLLALQNWCTTNYLIHGLWSDYTPTSYPSFCADIPFSLDELTQSPVYDDLLLNWSDCNYNDTIALYEHEWLSLCAFKMRKGNCSILTHYYPFSL